jgi:hypothetical protein
MVAQRADALGNRVHGIPQLGVLPMNMVCSVLNIGPVTFQWKLCVVRYSV